MQFRLRSSTSSRQLVATPYHTITLNPEQERVITLTVSLSFFSWSSSRMFIHFTGDVRRFSWKKGHLVMWMTPSRTQPCWSSCIFWQAWVRLDSLQTTQW